MKPFLNSIMKEARDITSFGKVLDQSKSKILKLEKTFSELYIIFLKDIKCEDLYYGRNKYDYQAESLIFIAPGQTFGFETS
ncbi:MAG: hypothetical protein IPN86_24465 [Saprospiraceae bacterium]|nr:hypothetical protein [Saprospiraceae bacterium]